MTDKLKALLIGGIVATIGGFLIVNYTPKVSTEWADLLDAGILAQTVPRKLGCWVLYNENYLEFSEVVAVAKVLNGDGSRDAIHPRCAIPYRAVLLDENSNCRQVAVLAWDGGDFLTGSCSVSRGTCGCWARDAGACAWVADGGAVPPGTTLGPGTFMGAGCLGKTCGEVFGRSSMPVECQ